MPLLGQAPSADDPADEGRLEGWEHDRRTDEHDRVEDAGDRTAARPEEPIGDEARHDAERTVTADARAFLRAANERLLGKAVLDAALVGKRQAHNAGDRAAWEAASIVDADADTWAGPGVHPGRVDPVSGDGMYEGILSGSLATRAVLDVLEGREETLDPYGPRLTRQLAPLLWASWSIKAALDRFPRTSFALAQTQLVWNVVDPRGRGWVGGAIVAAVFMLPTIALWRARPLFVDRK